MNDFRHLREDGLNRTYPVFFAMAGKKLRPKLFGPEFSCLFEFDPEF
jgi:hypothetical protein